MSALLGIQMWMPQAATRAIVAECPMPVFHTYTTAGSWSTADHKNRKSGPAWLTSVSTT